MPMLIVSTAEGSSCVFADNEVSEELLFAVDALFRRAREQGNRWPQDGQIAVECPNGTNHYFNVAGCIHVAVIHGNTDPEVLLGERMAAKKPPALLPKR